MDHHELKRKLSKKFLEICHEGILLTYGVAHTRSDDNLSSKVASNAKKKICKGRVSSNDIIGVLDTSFTNSGKSGFAFTHEALFCSCFENTDSSFTVKYEDIDFVSYDDSDEDDIFIRIYRKNNSNYYTINIGAFSKKKIMWFLDYAKELYDEINDIELDWDKL